MRTTQYTRNKVVDLGIESRRALAKSGLSMIVGYIGASTLMLGLLSIFHGEGNPLAALVFLFAGGALAVYAWRSAYRVLGRVDTDTPIAGQARMAASRSASGLTTLVGVPEA